MGLRGLLLNFGASGLFLNIGASGLLFNCGASGLWGFRALRSADPQPDLPSIPHPGGCQKYGPFLGPHYNTAPNIYLGHPNRDPNFDNYPSRASGRNSLCNASAKRLTEATPRKQGSRRDRSRDSVGVHKSRYESSVLYRGGGGCPSEEISEIGQSNARIRENCRAPNTHEALDSARVK